MKKTILREYARLIARKGINVQRGDNVIIRAALDQPDFVYCVTDECYKAGARFVSVEFNHPPLQKLHYRHATQKTLSRVEDWEIKRAEFRRDTLPALIYLTSEDPDGLDGINQKKFAAVGQARYRVLKPINDAMENRYKWCIAAVPGEAWAKKVFPGERTSRAVEKLWEAILYTSRANGGDAVAAWDAHNADLDARCRHLNGLGIETLEYHASNGTDLSVGLMENSRFLGGSETVLGGDVAFNPNIPSEEVFITPRRGAAEGIVYASRPLSYNGQIIDGFSIRFHEGRAVEVHAEKNEELLRQMIAMDEGAAYLGECALVPYDSPIRRSGLLFYNTLFDENAACHLALGMGFANSIENYENYTLEECRAMGVNDSMIHEDFMIGTEDLDITAVTRDGRRVPLFRGGEWAF